MPIEDWLSTGIIFQSSNWRCCKFSISPLSAFLTVSTIKGRYLGVFLQFDLNSDMLYSRGGQRQVHTWRIRGIQSYSLVAKILATIRQNDFPHKWQIHSPVFISRNLAKWIYNNIWWLSKNFWCFIFNKSTIPPCIQMDILLICVEMIL